MVSRSLLLLLLTTSDVPPSGVDGSALFAAKCALCHKVGDRGHEFGPNLSDAGLRLTRESIVESIHEPSKSIATGHEYVELRLANGKCEQGILAPESAGMVLLRQPGGLVKRFEKGEVVSKTVLPVSAMTLFLEKLAPAEESALVEWLLTQRSAVKRDAVAVVSLERRSEVPRSFVIVGVVVTAALAGFLLRSLRK